MPHSSRRQSRHSRHKNKDPLKRTRYSFAIFAFLVLLFLFNVFFHANKTFVLVEVGLAGIAYLTSMQYVISNAPKLKTKELTFYLVTFAVVAMGVLFYLMADRWTTTGVSQITGIDE